MKHKNRRFIYVALLSTVSFVAGFAVASRLHDPIRDRTKSAELVRSPSGELIDSAPTRPPRIRQPRASSKAMEPRISIPIKSVTEILKKGKFTAYDFEGIEIPMNEALTLLGATEGERQKVIELMERTKTELYAAERGNLKPIVSETGVTFEMKDMYLAADLISQRTQQDMKDILPPDLAEALISSISWTRYYFNPRGSIKAPELRILRRGDGRLVTSTASPGHTSFAAIKGYLDDGSPIPAASVFPERWTPYLSGVSLIPVNEEE